MKMISKSKTPPLRVIDERKISSYIVSQNHLPGIKFIWREHLYVYKYIAVFISSLSKTAIKGKNYRKSM